MSIPANNLNLSLPKSHSVDNLLDVCKCSTPRPLQPTNLGPDTSNPDSFLHNVFKEIATEHLDIQARQAKLELQALAGFALGALILCKKEPLEFSFPQSAFVQYAALAVFSIVATNFAKVKMQAPSRLSRRLNFLKTLEPAELQQLPFKNSANRPQY